MESLSKKETIVKRIPPGETDVFDTNLLNDDLGIPTKCHSCFELPVIPTKRI